ncbi:DNA primase [Chryseobacterium artocarpi]|uniref:DNA primase n=1 Tax=Chryseobacterium artocarpi TaxID=1414727 RepID=A0A1B8ZC07_9FLAO|nr:toprim domain-containing protein [Chryseobacterium artocarpi]OCA69143.1 DNA primase [Chryseobacterium artocarpi]
MNCEQIKQRISIRDVLESYGLLPVKENRRTATYFALDRDEKTPSLSVDFVKNTAFDFGTGKSYDVISIVQVKNRCNVSEALIYLQRFDVLKPLDNNIESKDLSSYDISKIIDIQHPALLQYLESRKVVNSKIFAKEAHYIINKRKYFGIAFRNNSGGYEIRSKYSKICLGPKDVTLIKSEESQNTEVVVFEGFFDYLSYKVIEKNISSSETDYLILNSTSMLFLARDILCSYEKLSLFLDNDSAGKTAIENISLFHNNIEDCSQFYKDYEDLNKWLCR